MHFKMIELIKKDPTVTLDENDLWYFLGALECNGQILKSYKIVKGDNYMLFVSCPKPDSLCTKYDSIYVERRRVILDEKFEMKVTDIGRDIESREYCSCENRSCLEMQTHKFDIDSVFSCPDCGRPVALYELPLPEGQGDFCDIQLWRDNYSSMDMLWVNCLCDRYSGNQRVKSDSLLNKQGRELAKEISHSAKIPVYYHLQEDFGMSVGFEKTDGGLIHRCPICKEVMQRRSFGKKAQIDVCNSCEVSYDAIIDF